MDKVATFFHLLGALLLVAGIVLAGTAFETARRRQRPVEIALLLGLTRIGVLLGGLGGQRPKQARKLAQQLAADDKPANGQLGALLNDRVSLAENYASLLLILVILTLMVFKP